MNTKKVEAGLYTNRSGLDPESPVFVGRADTLTDLFRRVASYGRPSAAVVGARRIGKTSLLKQLLSKQIRERFQPNACDWVCTYLDCSSARWKGFGDFRQRLIKRITIAAAAEGAVVQDEDALEDIVAGLVPTSGEPLVAILDEFDSIAPELRKEDQAELRGAVNNVSQFAIILGVARQPDEVLEYIGDSASDLAPVIHIVQPSLAALSEDEARLLTRIGRTQATLDPDPEAEEVILELAGTHPLLVQAACYAWYSNVGNRTLSEISNGEREGALRAIKQEVKIQLAHVSRGLTARCKALITGSDPELSAADLNTAKQELAKLGLSTFAQANANPVTIPQDELRHFDDGDSVTSLTCGIDELNRRHQLFVQRSELIFRMDAVSGNDSIYLRRGVTNERDFKLFVEALARLLYDGSEAVTSPELRGKVKPKLPKFCYKDDRSVLVHLVALRNYYLHLQAPDSAVAQGHLRAIGNVFERYCGKRAPAHSDFDQIRAGLLAAANRFVGQLSEKLPIDDRLEPNDLFE